MKNYITTLLLLIISSAAQSQWVAQVSGNAAELRGVYFTNTQVGYIVGSDGVMIKTTDGGTNWYALNSGTIDTLRSVYFIDDTTGYACGAQGTIIMTTDSGSTWIGQTSNTTNLLRSIFFPSRDTGYCAGGGGVILKTTDAGNTWVQQTSGVTQDLISIRFINNDTGWAASSLGTFLSGIILKTTDGGTTWDTAYTHANGFLSVFCATVDTVYCAGGMGTIAKSVDGGTNWNVLTSITAQTLRGAFYSSSQQGFTVGDGGAVVFTNDGGTTYVNQGIQINTLLGVHFPHPDTGYACGTLGTILKYVALCSPGIPSAPSFVNGPNAVCVGDTAVYWISPVPLATSYTWTVPAGAFIISGQNDTLITVAFGLTSGDINVNASNICGISPTTIKQVTVYAPPATPIITQNLDTLISSSLANNQWYLNGVIIPGATGQTYVVTQNGTYTVIVTNIFGCTAMSAPFNVTNVGMNEIMQDGNAIAIQETANEILFLMPAEKQNIVLKIFDVNGREIVSYKAASAQSLRVPKENTSKGIYFYRIESANEKAFTGKIIIRY
ncbi:MAG: YCF48-related protein [Bacteroidia bacterium]